MWRRKETRRARKCDLHLSCGSEGLEEVSPTLVLGTGPVPKDCHWSPAYGLLGSAVPCLNEQHFSLAQPAEHVILVVLIKQDRSQP